MAYCSPVRQHMPAYDTVNSIVPVQVPSVMPSAATVPSASTRFTDTSLELPPDEMVTVLSPPPLMSDGVNTVLSCDTVAVTVSELPDFVSTKDGSGAIVTLASSASSWSASQYANTVYDPTLESNDRDFGIIAFAAVPPYSTVTGTVLLPAAALPYETDAAWAAEGAARDAMAVVRKYATNFFVICFNLSVRICTLNVLLSPSR